MITGYNHNIPHNGRTYHIQTEDSGLQHPHIITHLFVGGNIIHSKKRSYAHLLEEKLHEDEEAFEKKIREMMKAQHKEMLKELKAGKHDHVGTKKAAGALLTPGLLALSPDAEAGGDTEEAKAIPSLAAESAVEEVPLPSSPEPAPPALDALSESSPERPTTMTLNTEDLVVDEGEEAPSADEPAAGGSSKRGGLRARGARMGRSRPQFKAPPPSGLGAPKKSSAPSTTPDIPSFKDTDDISSAPPTTPGTRKTLRSQRGSGRGKRPELQLQPPSSRLTPPPKTPTGDMTIIDSSLSDYVRQATQAYQGNKEMTNTEDEFSLPEAVKSWLSMPSSALTPATPSRRSSPSGDEWRVDTESSGRAPVATSRTRVPAGPIHQAALDYLKKDR